MPSSFDADEVFEAFREAKLCGRSERSAVACAVAVAMQAVRPSDGVVEALEGIRRMLSGYDGQPNLMGDIFKIADAALAATNQESVGEK